MSDQQDRILRLFIEEAKEHLDTLEKGLVDLQSTMEDPENIQEMFRAAHSVKGGAAMLGLDSIKTTAHRLEDCFKILRDDSLKQVDQKSESMFLKGVDTLKELLERLERPFGLRKEEAEKMVDQIMPVFAELESHLTALANGTVPVAATAGGGAKVGGAPPANFAPQVMVILKEMLQVFKQAESPASRQQLAARCDRLLQLAPGIETWQTLVKTARGAIANPKTAYKTLAPLVIKELKDGGDLVQGGKAKAIAPSKGLQQLAVVSTAPSPSQPSAGAGAPPKKQVTIPLEPKAAVKVLLQSFDKKQLSEIAKLLVQAIKAKA